MGGGLGGGGNPIRVMCALPPSSRTTQCRAKHTSASTCCLRIIGLICHSPLPLRLTHTANSSAFGT